MLKNHHTKKNIKTNHKVLTALCHLIQVNLNIFQVFYMEPGRVGGEDVYIKTLRDSQSRTL